MRKSKQALASLSILYRSEAPGLQILRASRVHAEIENTAAVVMSTCQLYYCLSGGTRYQVDGTEYSLTPGSLLAVCPGERLRHLAAEGERYEFITVKFTADWASGLTDYDLLPLLTQFRYRKICEHAVDSLLRQLAAPCRDEKTRSRVCLAALLWRFAEAEPADLSPVPLQLSALIVSFVTSRALSLNTTEEITAHFRISRATLFRRFRQETGMPLWAYIREQRLTVADARIRAGEKPTDVCLRCGFSDYATFSAAYKRRFGISPKKASGTP